MSEPANDWERSYERSYRTLGGRGTRPAFDRPLLRERTVLLLLGVFLAAIAAEGPGEAVGAIVAYVMLIAAWSYLSKRRRRTS